MKIDTFLHALPVAFLTTSFCGLLLLPIGNIASAKNLHSTSTTSISSASTLSSAIQKTKTAVNVLPDNSISYITTIGGIANMASQQAQIPHTAGQSLLTADSLYAAGAEEMTAPPLHRVSQNTPNQAESNLTSTALLPESSPSRFAYFADIALIKEILPDDLFRSQVLPLVQDAFKNAPENQITPKDWRLIEKKIMRLKESHNVDFTALYLTYLEKKTIKESVSSILDQMSDDMDTLGDEIGDKFHKFLEDNKDLFSFEKEEETPPIHSL